MEEGGRVVSLAAQWVLRYVKCFTEAHRLLLEKYDSANVETTKKDFRKIFTEVKTGTFLFQHPL